MDQQENGRKYGLIVIDPGHGGDDNGAAYGFVEEDDTNLIIAFLLRLRLEALGYRVQLTRERDEAVSLKARSACANTLDADLFVSVHCDAFHNATARGMTVHVHPNRGPDTLRVASNISLALIGAFPGHLQRGVRESDFSVLRRTKMPAVLIECEFLSNPESRAFLKEPENQLALAGAIIQGIEKSQEVRG